MVVPGGTTLEIEVVKAVRAAVAPAFIRSVLIRASLSPEVAARLPEGDVTIAVRLTGDRELRRLNRAYAGSDETTDVLSFTGSDHHLGDLAISWPAVVRQAREFGHPVPSELALLCVHGLLHLLGWDHVTAAQRREMTRLTIHALDAGLAPATGRL
jgi:probable rRNA maturation factor